MRTASERIGETCGVARQPRVDGKVQAWHHVAVGDELLDVREVRALRIVDLDECGVRLSGRRRRRRDDRRARGLRSRSRRARSRAGT